MLGEHLLEGVLVDRAGVGERGEHFVAEHLLEPSRLERLTAQLPVRLRLLRIGQHLQALVPHKFVIKLTQAVLPRGVALKAPAGQLVVVGDEDVRVTVLARRVGMDDHHEIGGVHPFGEGHGHVPDAVEVFLLGHVELVRAEREDVALKLVLSAVRTRESLSALDKRQRRRRIVARDADSERRSTSKSLSREQLRTALVSVAVQDVGG